MFAVVLSILGFIAALAVLIIVHELGHFVVARLAKVKVLEFGFGFPPRLLGIRRGETLYSINAVPLGGFVKMLGEEDPSEPGSLAGKSAGVRFLVMAAGPFMNLVLAVLLFSALFLIPQQVPVGKVVVQGVAPDSPAQEAGLQAGDVIVAVNGRTLDNDMDLRYRVALSLGTRMAWDIQRGEQRITLRLVPRANPPAGQGATGILVTTQDYRFERRTVALWLAPIKGAEQVGQVLLLVRNEFAKWIAGGKAPEVTGPIGMAQVFGEVAREQGFGLVDRVVTTVNLAAMISLSLAIFNILPIPALDGGRILFVAIEWVRRGKRISPQKEGLVHLIGFVLLIALAVMIGFVDISRIFRGDSLLGG